MRAKRRVASTSQPPVCAMVSIISTPGSRGWPGKWPSNTGLSSGTVQSARTSRAAGSSRLIRSAIWKYSRRIQASGDLRRGQLVDIGAQVLEHEILVGGDLSLVDLLG